MCGGFRMQIKEWVSDFDPEILLADGLDEAFLGICERMGQEPVAAYDQNKCISIFMEQGMTEEEAEEFFEYNTIGAWVGDRTPVFITTFDLNN